MGAQYTRRLTELDDATLQACAHGDANALRTFERVYFPSMRKALTSMNLSPDEIGDVEQRVRDRLFVDRIDGRARILAVAGRGDLASLVKVAGIRIALNEVRSNRRRQDRHKIAADDPWAAGLEDPELSLLRADQRAAFKAAFETAVAAIDTRDRNVLRMHLVDRLSIDQIAAAFGAHRATAARWLAKARTEVAERTQAELESSLALPAPRIKDAVDLVRSRLDLSLSRLLSSQSEHLED